MFFSVCCGTIKTQTGCFILTLQAANLFTIIWSIVTAIAVLHQDMWKACANGGAEGTGKYQQVRALTGM
jgi:hypothetical protein